MELLYGLGIAIVLGLVLRAAQWFREYQRRLRVRLERVPPGPDPDQIPHPELGKVKVLPRVQPRLETGTLKERQADVELASVLGVSAIAQPEETGAVEENKEEDNVPVLLTPVASSQKTESEQQDMFAHETIEPPPFRKNEPVANRASVLYEKTVEPVRAVATVVTEEKPHTDVQDVIALHVVAREYPFNGEDLLRSVLSYGLRYGEMAIFHRHERPTGQGRILFSMAKAVEPGTFDLEAMTGEEIPGVSFFLSLPGVNSIHAYDIMVDTAKRLATELQGEILDEQQQPLTRQLVEHYRERVQEFERRRLMQRP